MAEEKMSTLLSDVLIEGDIVEKDKRSKACIESLVELNPYVEVQILHENIDTDNYTY